jgi:phage minor structural protein
LLYLLDKDTKTVKWNGIPLHEASSAVVKEETNGDFYLTVHYPITDSGVYQLIKEDMLIKAPVPVLGAQLFRIKKPVENDDSLDITAYHISDDVMQRSIRPVSVVGQGCAMALSQMVQNAKTDIGTFSFTSDIMDSRTFNTTETETLYTVLMDGKHSIVGTWEGELVRNNFALSIKRSRGADRGVVITTHKNLKSYQRTKNSQSVVTRIHAKSTFKAEGAETDTILTVTVDSPLIGDYPYINEKEYENNDAKTIDELKKWAEAKFTNEGIDKVSDAIEIEAYELDGQVVHLGDAVNIKSRKHDVDIYKKAIAYEYNALTEEYISITFDDKPGVGGSGVSSGVSNAADVILSANRNAQEVAIERAVRNANQAFDTEFDKRVEVINDGIEQAKAEAELYAYNIKQSIDADVNAIIQSMQAQSEEHDSQVADILSKTQSVESLANQAKTDAANAITTALQSKDEAIANATAQVATVETKVNQLINEVSSKVSKTDYNTLTGRVSSAETAITQNATEISKRLTSAQVEQAITDKGYATVTVLNNKVEETVDSFSRTISETKALIPTSIGGRNLFKGSQDFSGVWYNAFNGAFFEEYEGVHIHKTKTAWQGKSQIFYVKSGEIYTFSFYAKSDSENDEIMFFLSHSESGTPANGLPYFKLIAISTDYRRYSITFKITSDGIIIPRFERSNTTSYLFFGGFKLETGSISTDWSPAPEDLATVTALHAVNDTVDSHTRTIGAVGTTGSILDDVSKVTQTANGLVTEVSGANGLKTQVSTLAGSYAIQNLTNSGTVLNQLNLNKDGSIKIDGKLVQITGTTYIEDGVISAAKIGDLDAGKITTGTLNAARIAVNSIDGSKLVFDQAFFNNFMANDAYLKQVFAKNAFITSVQTVAISASNVTTGILRATNGAMDINLDNASMVFRQGAKIEFQSENNTLFRTRNGTSAFIHFRDDEYNGVYTVMGVNADNTGTQNDYSSSHFAGVRVVRANEQRYSGPIIDQVQLIGDKVLIGHGYGQENEYLTIIDDGGPKINLTAWLRQFNINFMHLVNITGRGDVIKTF